MTAPLSNLFVWSFLIFAITTGGTLYYLVTKYHQEMAFKNAVLTAEITAENIDLFRSFYSSEVIGNLRGSDVHITHKFRDHPGAVPLPATLSIEFGEFMRKQASVK